MKKRPLLILRFDRQTGGLPGCEPAPQGVYIFNRNSLIDNVERHPGAALFVRSGSVKDDRLIERELLVPCGHLCLREGKRASDSERAIFLQRSRIIEQR